MSSNEPFGTPSGPPPEGGTPPPPPSYPPPSGYGGAPAGGFGAPAATQPNGLAIGALVCGILSLVCFPPLGLVAVPLGVVALGRANKAGGTGKGLAIGGIVTGVLGALATIVIGILLVVGVSTADDVNSDPADGVCNEDRFLQDPDC